MKTKGILAIVVVIALALLGFSCSSNTNQINPTAPPATPPTTTAAVAPTTDAERSGRCVAARGAAERRQNRVRRWGRHAGDRSG